MVTCPTCGRPAIAHWENVPVKRTILNNEDGALLIEGLIQDTAYEVAVDEVLMCDTGHEFPIPDDVEVHWS